MTDLIDLDTARAHIADACASLPGEMLKFDAAIGRVCSEKVMARVSHPPADLSAMDGYAVRHADCAGGATLRIVGESRAGTPFDGTIGTGEATLVSTGAHMPAGSDHVLILEDARREGDRVTVVEEQSEARHIRRAGMDFAEGDVLVRAGVRLTPAHMALAAAAGGSEVTVARQPQVAILTNGDELRDPGEAPDAATVYDSNSIALAAQFSSFGASARWIGRAGDDAADVEAKLASGDGADLLVVAGGASVGPHDLVKGAFAALGGEIIFSKVALRPGKPVWFGTLPSGTRVLGLPGNPASSYVCAHLFGKLAVERLSGLQAPVAIAGAMRTALAAEHLAANGPRPGFHRAALQHRDDGTIAIALTGSQDSSLLKPLAAADALLFQNANAPAVGAGARVSYLPLS